MAISLGQRIEPASDTEVPFVHHRQVIRASVFSPACHLERIPGRSLTRIITEQAGRSRLAGTYRHLSRDTSPPRKADVLLTVLAIQVDLCDFDVFHCGHDDPRLGRSQLRRLYATSMACYPAHLGYRLIWVFVQHDPGRLSSCC